MIRQSVVHLPNIRFHEQKFNGVRIVLCVQTDGAITIGAAQGL